MSDENQTIAVKKKKKRAKSKKKTMAAEWWVLTKLLAARGWANAKKARPFWPLGAVVIGYSLLTMGMWSVAGVSAEQRIQTVTVYDRGEILQPDDVRFSSIERKRADEVAEICRAVQQRNGLSETLCADLAKALNASPWVQSVESVRRDGLNHLVVRLSLRDPIAVLAVTTNGCVISADNVRLPWDIQTEPLKWLPLIYIDDGLLPRQPGEAIEDAPIVGAVRTINAVKRFSDSHRLKFTVEAARLKRAGAGFSLVMYTNMQDIRIVWGSVSDTSEEPTSKEKLDLIERRVRTNRARLQDIQEIIVKDKRGLIRLKSLRDRVRRR